MTGPVLFVIGDLDVGGAEIHLVRILPCLRRRGLAPLVYTLTHKSELARQLEASGIEVLAPPLAAALRPLPRALRRGLLLPLTVARLVVLMRARRPAVVHFFLPAAYLVGGVCAWLAGQRVCVMSRRSLNDYQRGHPVLTRLERALHPRMAAILGNSRAVVAQLRAEGVPPARVGLIYNGVDPRPFADVPPRAALRTRWAIEPSALVLTTVANLIPYKGHPDLLDALAAVAGALPAPWLLLCVGRDDGIGDALRAQARARGLAAHVRWLGERHDVPEILAMSDVGVLASHQEGFSNSVLEGMAAGLPMVVTGVGGNPEAVVQDVTGLVVPPRDPGALGRALLALARDPEGRRRMGDAARQRVGTTFSLEACAARYAELYALLAADARAPVCDVLSAEGPS